MLVFGTFLFSACRKNDYSHLKDRPMPVEIEVVSEGSNSVTDTYVGEIIAKADIPLVFPLGGQLTSIQVKSGVHVREGASHCHCR